MVSMMFSKKKCAFLAACVALSSALPADPIKLAPFSSASPRMSALGGAHAAHARGMEALFENPAGFADEDTVFSVGALSLLLQGPIFDIANLMFSGSGIMTGLPTLLDAKGKIGRAHV